MRNSMLTTKKNVSHQNQREKAKFLFKSHHFNNILKLKKKKR